MISPSPHPSTSAVDHAAQVIRERVGAGDLVPGQRLVEPDLAADLGVSRATLREAFRALEAEGLVTMARYKGASVRQLDPDELTEAFEIRELLEGLAARRAAPHFAKGSMRKRLIDLRDAMDRAARSRTDPQRYTQLNRDFHELILLAAGSAQLHAMAAHIRPPAILRIIHRRLLEQEVIGRSMAEHRLICSALLDGNADRAEKAMRRHIRSSMKALPNLLR